MTTPTSCSNDRITIANRILVVVLARGPSLGLSPAIIMCHTVTHRAVYALTRHITGIVMIPPKSPFWSHHFASARHMSPTLVLPTVQPVDIIHHALEYMDRVRKWVVVSQTRPQQAPTQTHTKHKHPPVVPSCSGRGPQTPVLPHTHHTMYILQS